MSCYQPPGSKMLYDSERDYKERRLPIGMLCVCGDMATYAGPGMDIGCVCGREYNSAGQLLAPREQWGEETGETAADLFVGDPWDDR